MRVFIKKECIIFYLDVAAHAAKRSAVRFLNDIE